MLSKFSGSHQNLRYCFLLAILLGALEISLFLAVSMGSVQISSLASEGFSFCQVLRPCSIEHILKIRLL